MNISGLKARSKYLIEQGIINLNKYLENPHLCLYCKSPILPKNNQPLNATKMKKFCNHSCSCIYSNIQRGFSSPQLKICKRCGSTKTRSPRSLYCKSCTYIFPEARILNHKKSESSHRQIREHSRRVMINSKIYKKCHLCPYTKHVEACHIKPIEKFSPDTLIRVINDMSNLVWLCPNHHWEFDHLHIPLLQS